MDSSVLAKVYRPEDHDDCVAILESVPEWFDAGDVDHATIAIPLRNRNDKGQVRMNQNPKGLHIPVVTIATTKLNLLPGSEPLVPRRLLEEPPDVVSAERIHGPVRPDLTTPASHDPFRIRPCRRSHSLAHDASPGPSEAPSLPTAPCPLDRH